MKKSILIVTLAIMVAACGGSTESPSTSGLDPEIEETAMELYTVGNAQGATACQACHSLDGTELVGPSMQGMATRADDRIEGVSAEEYLRSSILQPAAYVVEGYSNAMPSTYADALTEEEVDALVEWMLTFDEGEE